MKTQKQFDAIIIGGSYSGLAAGMALGRALCKVLIIDSGKPCNAQTPHSHNFLTRDGETPADIAKLGREQVEKYSSVNFWNGAAIKATKVDIGFEIDVSTGEVFLAKKLIFATGIRDMLPDIEGLSECWGISVLHCPFCHGYEVRNEKTGIIGNGEQAYELVSLISNWTNALYIFTNGPAIFTKEQSEKLTARNIKIFEKPILKLEHTNGYIQNIVFSDNSKAPLTAAYIRAPFRQVSSLPEFLGCALTEEGYIKVDASQATNIPGVFASGDNVTRTRTVANAVSTGTTAGMTVSRQLITEQF
ncbi:NAD(P)/FAD-dependent oxidoreductase [Mucilaginibacter terrigena]|uniref:NAD(P)/FAD-dependent oxidoreductase n=1 Tax=Mucilaginibacter terrigena TaxID=2492395 RepID=A0A4Q5LQY6_9SPHI|nr:NAD(P)/FAD-dependent oxidoreductase [Mucilaginibacter terrigena]RYU91928.1 NAD(P)/FAD-dependent oxidoreductase [Mucilaginibacter terrigena]